MTDWVERLKRALQGDLGRLAEEARIEGGTALRAVELDTPEGDIQAATQRDAWTTQIARLEAIDNRNRDQEYLLRQLRRNVRELDAAEARRHATPAGLGSQRLAAFGAVGQRRGFLGPFAAAPLATLLMSPWTWLVALVALLGVQTMLKERIEDQRDDARADLAMAERHLENARAIQERLREEVIAADQLSHQTAENLEAERARNRAAAARERRRQSELRQVDAGGPPPDWERSLRNDPAVEGAPGASGGDSAPGLSR